MNRNHQDPWRIAAPGADGPGAIFLPSVGEYPIYDSTAYDFMLEDEHRMKAFRQALDGIVRPDSTVVEFGAGSVAPWARHAADLGAGRILAVEVIPEVRDVLRQSLSADPRYARIEVVSEEEYKRTQVHADILVSEVIGAIGSSEGAYRLVNAEIERIDNDELHILPNAWTTSVSAFSWRRMLRGSTPSFAAASSAYLAKLLDLLGNEDPRLCIVGPSFRLGLMSDAQAIEAAGFQGRRAHLDLNCRSLDIVRDGYIDSLLLTVDVAIGQQIVSSMRHASSWLPVVVPFSQCRPLVRRGDRVEVSMRHQYVSHPTCPDYEIDWKLCRSDIEIASGTEHLPWQPSGGAGKDTLHAALSTRGTLRHESES